MFIYVNSDDESKLNLVINNSAIVSKIIEFRNLKVFFNSLFDFVEKLDLRPEDIHYFYKQILFDRDTEVVNQNKRKVIF